MPFALIFCFSSCQTDELEKVESVKGVGSGLTIIPQLQSGQTRAVGDKVPGEDPLLENTLNTLDVFVAVKGQTAIKKQWHLTIAEATSKTVEEKVRYLLEDNWENSTLDKETTYTVYVAVNNDQTTSDVASVTELAEKNVTDNKIFTHNDPDNYRAGSDATHQYGTDSFNNDDKEFVMSGVLTDWTSSLWT